MTRLAVVVVFLCTVILAQDTKAAMELSSAIQRSCLPENAEEISEVDILVTEMFHGYKTQAQAETPPAEFSDNMLQVDAHKMLARFLFFIKSLTKESPEDSSTKPYEFKDIESDEKRWASDRRWPYRCYEIETIKALDLFVTDPIHIIKRLMNDERFHLAAVLFGIIMDLPQFGNYVGSLHHQHFSQVCPVILSSSDPSDSADKVVMTLTAISSLMEVACQAPFESTLFCNMPEIKHDLDLMFKDLRRAEESPTMIKFAFFWLYDSSLARACEDSFISTRLQTEVIEPFASLVVPKLNEIISVESTTGDDLTKIRTFIYDFFYNHYTNYIAARTVVTLSPQAPFEASGNKYSSFASHQHKIYKKPQKDLLWCYRAFVAAINNIESALRDGEEISKVKSLAKLALFWFLHPDFQLPDPNEHYRTLLDGLMFLLPDITAFKNFAHAIKEYKIKICGNVINSESTKFCKVYDVLLDIEIYATIYDDDSSTKILNPASNYKKILELSSMRSIQSEIAALEIGQEQLRQTLYNMRSSLGDHFHQLATFDQDKAEYDVGFLLDKIADFTTRINNVGLEDKLASLLNYAVASNVAELTQLGTQLAAAVASNFNPMKWLAGGGGIQDVLDQANALAEAGVNTAKLVNIAHESFPKLTDKANQLSAALESNAGVHEKLNTTFHQLKDKQSIDIDTIQSSFLIDYRGYDPGWSAGDIADYTVLLQEVIEDLCDILYDGGTVASAVAQGIGATKGVCLNIKTDAGILQAVYSEMYDFQYEFMEAMAMAVRALITKHSANTVRHLPEQSDDPEYDRFQLKLYAYRIKLQSKHHVLLALKEVCNVDEYKNGGIATRQCSEAITNPSNPAIDEVIGSKVSECPSDQVSTFYARIPARSNPNKETMEKGVIDLTKLYSGELTHFQIPFSTSSPWIHTFVSYTMPANRDIALYMKQFELYLPDTSDPENPTVHDVHVEVKQDGATNVMDNSQIKYSFSTPKVFNLRYGENKERCPKDFQESAYPTLCEPAPTHVCVASQGEISENEIAPPFHGNWLIRMTRPSGIPIPNPSPQSLFYLRAAMSICLKNPKNIDIDRPPPNVNGGSTTDRCCRGNQYWYISDILSTSRRCADCPPDSTPKLGGLYCEDTTLARHDKKHHIKHHHLKSSIFSRKKVKKVPKVEKMRKKENKLHKL